MRLCQQGQVELRISWEMVLWSLQRRLNDNIKVKMEMVIKESSDIGMQIPRYTEYSPMEKNKNKFLIT